MAELDVLQRFPRVVARKGWAPGWGLCRPCSFIPNFRDVWNVDRTVTKVQYGASRTAVERLVQSSTASILRNSCMAVNASKLKRRPPAPPADIPPTMNEPETSAARVMAVSGGLPKMDGRSLRATGRTVQLNLKVSPDTKARFLALAASRGRLMADLFEEAVAILEKVDAGR